MKLNIKFPSTILGCLGMVTLWLGAPVLIILLWAGCMSLIYSYSVVPVLAGLGIVAPMIAYKTWVLATPLMSSIVVLFGGSRMTYKDNPAGSVLGVVTGSALLSCLLYWILC